MTGEEGKQRIISALESAVIEHGWPNSFTAGELTQYCRKLSPMLVGRWAWRAVDQMKLEGWRIEYNDCRFTIDFSPRYGVHNA